MAFPRRISAALICALAALAFATSATATTNPSTDIIGGSPIGSDSAYPFLTAVLAAPNPSSMFYCGGSLIAPRWVMTAAHCYAPAEGLTPEYVGIGTRDRSDPTMQVIRVTSHFRNPNYNDTLLQNDVMLLHLESAPVGITPLPRATPDQDPPAGATATLIGWGLTMTNAPATADTPQIANQMSTEALSNANCATAWGKFASIVDSEICTYHNTPTFHSGCNGDSGGPLIYGNRAVGIVSYGVAGCTSEAPSVYTRVSAFNGWIDGTMQKNLLAPDVAVPFGTVDTDAGAVTKTITVTSDGEQPITITGTATTGDYAVQATTCTASLAPGQSCAITVAFDPTLGGTRPGTLKIATDSAGTAVNSVPLTGNGFGRSSKPVTMHLKHGAARRVGNKVKVTYKMTFKVPDGVTPSYACTGKLKAKMAVGGHNYSVSKRVYGVPGQLGQAPQCYAKFTLKMSASALGRKGRLTLRFPSNKVLVTSKRTVSLRVK